MVEWWGGGVVEWWSGGVVEDCELAHEPGGFAMSSHGSAERSEDYPWCMVRGILPRSGRPMAAKW